jgi:hypothetical protein
MTGTNHHQTLVTDQVREEKQFTTNLHMIDANNHNLKADTTTNLRQHTTGQPTLNQEADLNRETGLPINKLIPTKNLSINKTGIL